jgi:hypothetical protein
MINRIYLLALIVVASAVWLTLVIDNDARAKCESKFSEVYCFEVLK